MLLFLHENIFDLDFSNNELANHAIENILASGVDGNHLILAELTTLRRLAELNVLSARSKSYLRRMINSFSEVGSLIRSIDFFYTIEGPLVDPYKVDGGESWHIPLLSFNRMESVAKTTLLAENLTDCKIYQHAADHFRILNGFRNLKISFTNQGGGGSTTAEEIRRRVADPTGICLCIIDSDRLSPNSDIGLTAQSCLAAVNDSQKWWLELFLTLKRELENELPESFVVKALTSNAEFQNILDTFLRNKESLTTIDIQVISYLDLKEGLSLNWILSQSESVKAFWLNAIGSLVVESHCKTTCMSSTVCGSLELEDQRCRSDNLVSGIGKSLLTIVLNWLNTENPVSAAKMLKNSGDDGWLVLGRKVFHYGVSGHVVRV